MKKVIFCTAMLVSVFAAKAQQIQLDEAKVLYTPQIVKVVSDNSSSTYEFKIKESTRGDFHRDPIAFMNKHVKLNAMMDHLDQESQSFTVTFKSEKGRLIANFSKDGELISTNQNFKNIIVPKEIREELYRDYKGWSMVKNKYVAKGDSQFIEKQTYRVKLKKGKRSKIITIQKDRQEYALANK